MCLTKGEEMRKVIFLMVVALTLVGMSSVLEAQEKWDNLLIESAKVFEDMTDMPDQGIPESLLKDCYAVAIFPSTVGGGFIVGGKYGQGIIVAKDKKAGGWSAPAVFNIIGASFGWQIGGQATDIILLVMSERGLDGLLQSKLKLGGDAAVSAGPVGREAEASTDLQLKGGILSYSRSRGLFVGVKLDGSVISFNKTANDSLYGSGVSAGDLLVKKDIKPTGSASRLLEDLKKY
jgi:SH3 domain-containing YSC84-like protein 1